MPSPPVLSHVGLAVTDVAAAARTLTDGLGLVAEMAPGGVPLFGAGAASLALYDAADPALGGEARAPGVHHIAFAGADPGVLLAGAGLGSGALVPDAVCGEAVSVDAESTCGVRLRIVPEAVPAERRSGPVERIDHIGVASRSNADAHAVFVDRLGCPVESMQTDMEVRIALESFTSDRYGVVYHSREPEPIAGLRVSFLTAGDCELEFLEPFAPGDADDADGPVHAGPGNTRGDKGAIGRYLERRGPGLHHLALKVGDIDATLARLAGAGVELIDSIGRPGSRRARIGFIRPRALGGVLVHLVERDER